MKQIWFLSTFDMILKAILCVQDFYSFGAMLFTANLLLKTDSTVICALVCLSMFVMSPFFFKNRRFGRYLRSIGLLVYCLKFTSLTPGSSK